MTVSANLHNNRLIIKINDKEVRNVSPLDKGVYKFKCEGEECYFVYEEHVVVSRKYKRVFFYPINLFKPNNMIEL